MIKQDSTPRIVKFGEYDGCPCGGTHVSDISIIGSLKVIRHFHKTLIVYIILLFSSASMGLF